MRVLRIAVLAVALSGCYTYGPMTNGAPELGKPMRVTLTLTGGDSLARWLGPNVATVDGRLVLATESAYELGVTSIVMHSGMEQYWKGETVTIPKSLISSVQARKFSWAKTGVLAGVVVVTVLALQQSGAIGGSQSHGSPGGPQ
jgi:hypothetical protein